MMRMKVMAVTDKTLIIVVVLCELDLRGVRHLVCFSPDFSDMISILVIRVSVWDEDQGG